jgi:DNA-binding MarR family transcriptional regulator
VSTANALLALVNADRDRIAGLSRAAASALDVHQALQRQPIATSAALAKATRLTPATVHKSLAHLERIGIVGEVTNRRRGRVFSYRKYVEELTAELRHPAHRPAGCQARVVASAARAATVVNAAVGGDRADDRVMRVRLRADCVAGPCCSP